MKIGVLTYHSVCNFGANLQCYSTVSYLKNNGFDPIVIDWIPEDLELKDNNNTPPVQAEKHKDFVKKYLPTTKLCRTSNDICQEILNENIKLVIIGSDAVLQNKVLLDRISINKKGIRITKSLSNLKFPSPFWGSFVEELKDDYPMAFLSASSMNMNYKMVRGGVKRSIGKALSKFKIITVRDDWTKKVIKYFTRNKITPKVTPDPVFSYNQNVREQLTKEEVLKRFKLPEKYILLSFNSTMAVSQNWINSFRDFVETKGFACVFLTAPEGKFPFTGLKQITPPLCPTEWYALIKYSSGYVGERMHPVIVSLHNSVPLFSFDSYGIKRFKYFINKKSSKIYDILAKAGYLENVVNFQGKGYKSPDPIFVARKVLEFDREKCKKFSSKQSVGFNETMKYITSLVK